MELYPLAGCGCPGPFSAVASLSHQPIAQVPARTDLDYAVRLLANPLKQKSQTSSVSRQMPFLRLLAFVLYGFFKCRFSFHWQSMSQGRLWGGAAEYPSSIRCVAPKAARQRNNAKHCSACRLHVHPGESSANLPPGESQAQDTWQIPRNISEIHRISWLVLNVDS